MAIAHSKFGLEERKFNSNIFSSNLKLLQQTGPFKIFYNFRPLSKKQINQTDSSLIGIDVPVNLPKYGLKKKKNHL